MMKRVMTCVFLVLTLLVPDVVVYAQILTNEKDTDVSKASTGLPLPRFASLKTGEVNLRTGPGMRFPIEWVITKKGLPVEIIAEYEFWRQIRTHDGDEGWVHKSALSGKRACIVTGFGVRPVYADDQPHSPTISKVEPGVLCQIVTCGAVRCHVNFQEGSGFLMKTDFWGVAADEIIN